MQYTERYARQIMLPEIGLSGQQALARASVLIVGAGGLGSPISLYLCTAGIGRIGLIDGDTVSESNLQRQILYTENETGRNKVECAKQTLSSRNESCRIDIYPHFLTEENAREIIEPYDIIVDGCDNYATRYLIDDWCSRLQNRMYTVVSKDSRVKYRYSTAKKVNDTPTSFPTARHSQPGPKLRPVSSGLLRAS